MPTHIQDWLLTLAHGHRRTTDERHQHGGLGRRRLLLYSMLHSWGRVTLLLNWTIAKDAARRIRATHGIWRRTRTAHCARLSQESMGA